MSRQKLKCLGSYIFLFDLFVVAEWNNTANRQWAERGNTAKKKKPKTKKKFLKDLKHTVFKHSIRPWDCQRCPRVKAQPSLTLWETLRAEIKLLRLCSIWITLNGFFWKFQRHVTNTRLHTSMSSAGSQTPHRLLPFERLKELKRWLLPWTKPHHSFSTHQSRSGQTTPFPSSQHPARDQTSSRTVL